MMPLLNGILTFQFGGFYGGDIGNLLSSWEQAGVFSYVLPFLLIFAVIFGILTRTKIFGAENKGLNAVVSLVIGLLALQFELVPLFFSEIFPNLGVALSVILVAMILIGLFWPNDRTAANWILVAGAAIIFIIVVSKSFDSLGYSLAGYGVWDFIYRNLGLITAAIIIMVVVAVVVGAGTGKARPYKAIWQQAGP